MQSTVEIFQGMVQIDVMFRIQHTVSIVLSGENSIVGAALATIVVAYFQVSTASMYKR